MACTQDGVAAAAVSVEVGVAGLGMRGVGDEQDSGQAAKHLFDSVEPRG